MNLPEGNVTGDVLCSVLGGRIVPRSVLVLLSVNLYSVVIALYIVLETGPTAENRDLRFRRTNPFHPQTEV